MRQLKAHLYNDRIPNNEFNRKIIGWLDKSINIVEHNAPAAFDSVRIAYDEYMAQILQATGDSLTHRWAATKSILSNLTNLMFGIDITAELAQRLSADHINTSGFRTTLSQGAAKNTGENFINAIVYGLASVLSFQDEVLVDKGLPPILIEPLTLCKTFVGTNGNREITLPIEGDLTIFSRSDPSNAIIINAKTRLKEIFHIGTMWKLFFDMLEDTHCLDKWGLRRSTNGRDLTTNNLLYVFSTADMIREDGTNSQGCDVGREDVRNLIAADASFFDYVFVSKQGITHVSNSLTLANSREALFHELGCLLDLIQQKYNLTITNQQ